MFQVHSIFCSKNVTKNFLTQSSCFCYALCCLLSQIAKEAKDCVQECVSEFVSFITSEYPCIILFISIVVILRACSS